MWDYEPHYTIASRPRVNKNTIKDGKIVKETNRLSLYRKSNNIDDLTAKSTMLEFIKRFYNRTFQYLQFLERNNVSL